MPSMGVAQSRCSENDSYYVLKTNKQTKTPISIVKAASISKQGNSEPVNSA